MSVTIRGASVWALLLLSGFFGTVHCSSEPSAEAPDGGEGRDATSPAERDDGGDVPPPAPDAGADVDAAPPPKVATAVPYTNPVFAQDFPDPAALRAPDGVFHAFATGGLIQHATSKDLVRWTKVGDALAQKPTWANQKNNFWAPDIVAHDGTFYLYFSAEQNTGSGSHCVGVATSKSIDGPFVDVGKPIVCSKNFAAIDPKAYDDPSGKRLLYWGSGFEAIHVRELAANRTEFAAGSTTRDLIPTSKLPYERLVEGAWIHPRDGYTYLFYAGDNCCGAEAHYAVMIARAKDALGPFEGFTKTGASDNTMLVRNDTWNAPGHNAIVTDDAGDDWMLYHAIERAKPGPRKMLLDKITYVNGWPTIATKSPSTSMQTGPKIAAP